MSTLYHDLKFALRMLAKSPGFTLVVVLTLALAIGANTAIFSVVNATLLARPAYTQPGRLVMVWEWNRRLFPSSGAGGNSAHNRNTVNPGNFLHWRRDNTVFDQMAAWYDFNTNLTGTAEPERLAGQAVTPEMMSLLGVRPLLGRTFVREDGEPGKDNVAVLSYGLWQRRFGSDASILGRTLTLDGKPITVVGVMPRGFQFFVAHNSFTGEPPEIWEPLAFNKADWTPVGRYLSALARLKPGVSLARAQSEMDAIAAGLARQFPEADTGWSVNLVPLHEQLVGGMRPALLILLGAVGFVLLVACANVANLQLVRATTRQRELAMRAALGASPRRIARQLLTENLTLAAAGGAAGVLLAYWAVEFLLLLRPRTMIELASVHLDWRVLAFTGLLVIFTAILFGLAPAWNVLRRDVHESLKEQGRSGGQSRGGNRVRGVFIVAETALALALLVGAGLLIRSLARLESVPAGFDPANLLTVRLDLPEVKYAKPEERIAFFRRLLERIRALPGVVAASGNSFPPFAGPGAGTDFTIPGRPAPASSSESPGCEVRVIEPDYFRTMHIPLVRGRYFTEREETEESHVVIINERLAREFWPHEDPLGRQITIDMKDVNVPTTIVGIAGDSKDSSLGSAALPTAYWPHPELPYNFMTLVIRTAGDPQQLSIAVQREVRALDRDLPVSRVRTMDQWMADSLAPARFNTILLGAFAAIALALAVIGVYGVMAYSVTERTQEIGVRMALGAQTRDVLHLVLRRGMSLLLAGVAMGLALSLSLARVLESLLFQMSAFDPGTFAAVAGLFSAVAGVACYIPARRAMRVDPMTALRNE
ncbi:MAG TPA: ABC transporter permease [Candidatus Sulfotelmatobacter sp.]|nr:ABC transporter permease [Candidatus Sulfotelmatobacter sp.]